MVIFRSYHLSNSKSDNSQEISIEIENSLDHSSLSLSSLHREDYDISGNSSSLELNDDHEDEESQSLTSNQSFEEEEIGDEKEEE